MHEIFGADHTSIRNDHTKQNSNAMHNDQRWNERCHQVGEIPLMRLWYRSRLFSAAGRSILPLVTSSVYISAICKSLPDARILLLVLSPNGLVLAPCGRSMQKSIPISKTQNDSHCPSLSLSLSLCLSLLSYSNCCGHSAVRVVCVVFALRCFVGWPNMCPACVCALHGSCLPVAPGVCVGVSPRVVQAVGSECKGMFPFKQLIRLFSARSVGLF